MHLKLLRSSLTERIAEIDPQRPWGLINILAYKKHCQPLNLSYCSGFKWYHQVISVAFSSCGQIPFPFAIARMPGCYLKPQPPTSQLDPKTQSEEAEHRCANPKIRTSPLPWENPHVIPLCCPWSLFLHLSYIKQAECISFLTSQWNPMAASLSSTSLISLLKFVLKVTHYTTDVPPPPQPLSPAPKSAGVTHGEATERSLLTDHGFHHLSK